MFAYCTALLGLCLHFSILSMANNKKDTHEDLLKTIAILTTRGEQTQNDRSTKEEKLRIKVQSKRKKNTEERLKQQLIKEIKEKFPGAPTPNNLEELKKLHEILFSKDLKKTFKREKKK